MHRRVVFRSLSSARRAVAITRNQGADFLQHKRGSNREIEAKKEQERALEGEAREKEREIERKRGKCLPRSQC